MSRDITLYNDNGTAYMISAADENYDLHIYRLTPDYLSVAPLVGNFWNDAHREAPGAVQAGQHLLPADLGGDRLEPEPGQVRHRVEHLRPVDRAGPTSATRTTFSSQPTYVLPIQGTSTTSYLYLGDRWAGAWGGPVNDSQYVWLPHHLPVQHQHEHELVPADHHRRRHRHRHRQRRPPYYRVTNRNSGKVMDVVSASTANNAEVKQ